MGSIECRGGLIGEQQPGAKNECPGCSDSLLLPDGETIGRLLPEGRCQTESLQQLLRRMRRGLVGDAAGQQDILNRGEIRQEIELLKDHPNRASSNPISLNPSHDMK